MGYVWALTSVLLVSLAQLALKQAMSTLPPLQQLTSFLPALLRADTAVLLLAGGLAGYGLSMGCWFLALRKLALGKAYSLLSLSYILVWLLAGLLPGWHEPYTLRALAGLLAISGGVLLVVSSRDSH